MRVIHCDFGREWRGGQQQLLLLARQLAAGGDEQVVIAPSGAVGERFRSEGLAVMTPGWGAARLARRSDVAHAHDGRALGWMLAATACSGAVRVASRRVAFPLDSGLGRWKWRRADSVLAVSQFVRGQLIAAGVRAEHITVIHDGYDAEALPENEAARRAVRARVRGVYGLGEALPCLVSLSAFTPEKGVGDLLTAMAAMASRCHLLLPGEGPLRAALAAQASASVIGARVHFVGELSGAAIASWEWVAAADVYVAPSREEGLGSALLLAQALECPIVACEVGGIPELVTENTGMLVPPAAPAALAAALDRVLGDAELARRLARNAAAGVRERSGAAALGAATRAAYTQARARGARSATL